MKILISGASGFVGTPLCAFLKNEGHELTSLVRREPQKGSSEIEWDPMDGNFAAGRWNKVFVRHDRQSKVK